MDYYFLDFHFNSQNLMLTRAGQDVAIRNNEARLLAFFLAAPEQVFNKEAILDNVWSGKVVSEQAVFQAISNLRALFGEGAIKTFPKKGYQWQIGLAHCAPAQAGTAIEESKASTTHTDSMMRPESISTWWRWSVAAILLTATGVVFGWLAEHRVPTSISPMIVLSPFAV
ncbi:MAG TPA: winged helix-turn-helix domain-containing protein, partial [Cellvibrio sp.]|nr:winged helix-turn-helix domain-containing protein [Cellvibrio sp.]